MINNIKNKKGDVSVTLVWIVATVAVCLILIVYAFFVAFLIVEKKFASKNSIKLSEGSISFGNLESQNELYLLLNSPLEKSEIKNVEGLIYQWSGDVENKDLKDELTAGVNKISKERIKDETCYFFHIMVGDNIAFIGSDEVLRGIAEESKVQNPSQSRTLKYFYSAKINLYKNNQEINVLYYLGACSKY